MKFSLILSLILIFSCQRQDNQSSAKLSGERLYIENNCITCHSIDGAKMIGPPLNNIYGTTVYHDDSTSSIVDEKYIIESIKYPSEKILKGYSDQMNSYKDLLSDSEIKALVEYIKGLKH